MSPYLRKTCIVAEGGGLRASYGVGVVSALIEKFQIDSVDMAVATSGSAGTLAYYVAGQFDSILNIWTNLLSTWKLVSFRNLLFRTPLLNVDYVIDVVFKQQDRLNVESLKSAATELFIPVTNYQTGEVKYFSNRDDVDFFEVLRATKAIGIFYGKTVQIGGDTYVDGALSAPIGVAKAIEAGATDIIVISTRSKDFKRSHSPVERILARLFSRRYPDALKRRMMGYPDTYSAVMDMVTAEIEGDRRNIVLIQPDFKPRAGLLDNSRASLIRCITQGYADACRHEELMSFGR